MVIDAEKMGKNSTHMTTLHTLVYTDSQEAFRCEICNCLGVRMIDRTLPLLLCVGLVIAVGCKDDVLAPDSSPKPPALRSTVYPDNVAELRAAVANAQPGETIHLKNITYDLGTEPIVISNKQNLYIRGDYRGSGAVVRTAAGAPYVFSIGANIDGLDFGHFVIEGTPSSVINTHGIASNSDRTKLTRVTIQNMEIRDVAVGISAIGQIRNTQCTGIDIYDNILKNMYDWPHLNNEGVEVTSGSGYGIHTENCSGVQIFGNVISDADRHSIYQAFTPMDLPEPGVKIVRNLIINHGQTASPGYQVWNMVALAVARSRGVTVANNIIVNSQNVALSIERALENLPEVPAPENNHVIANTVLGGEEADVYTETPGITNIGWGNRYVHRNENDVDTIPVYHAASVGPQLAEPTVPTNWGGTQAISFIPAYPFSYSFIMQSGWLHKVSTNFAAHPGSWTFTHNGGNPSLAGFQALETGNDRAYVMANHVLREFNPNDWANYRTSPTNWGTTFQAMAFHHADGKLYVIQGDWMHRVDPATWTYAVNEARWTSSRILVSFKDKLYAMRANCIESVDPQSFGVTTIADC